MKYSFQWALVFAAFAAVAYAVVGHSQPSNPSEVTVETFGAVERTDGFCFGATTTAANAWTSAGAQLDAVDLSKVRFVTIKHADSADSTVPVCAKLASTADGLTCDLGDATAGHLSGIGERAHYVLRRLSPTPIPLFVRASAGTVTVCVDVAW